MATTTTTTQNIRNWVSEVTQISAIVAVLDDAYTLLPSRRSGPPPSPLSPQQKLAQIGDVLAEVDPNVDRDAFLAPRTLSLPFTARSLLSHSAPKCDSKLVGILSDLIRREKEKESEKENGIYEWLVGEFAGVKETYEEQNEMWRVARGETEAIAKALEEMKREAEELVSVGNQARRELGVMMEKNDIEEQGSVCNQVRRELRVMVEPTIVNDLEAEPVSLLELAAEIEHIAVPPSIQKVGTETKEDIEMILSDLRERLDSLAAEKGRGFEIDGEVWVLQQLQPMISELERCSGMSSTWPETIDARQDELERLLERLLDYTKFLEALNMSSRNDKVDSLNEQFVNVLVEHGDVGVGPRQNLRHNQDMVDREVKQWNSEVKEVLSQAESVLLSNSNQIR